MSSNTLYTLYLVRNNTPAGFVSAQQFTTLEAAETFAKAYAIKWAIRFNDEVVSRGQR